MKTIVGDRTVTVTLRDLGLLPSQTASNIPVKSAMQDAVEIVPVVVVIASVIAYRSSLYI